MSWYKVYKEIEKLKRKVKCLNCCEDDFGITTLSPPVDPPGENDPDVLFNPETGELFYFHEGSWVLYGSVPSSGMVEVTYAEAQALATTGDLIPGAHYKITDRGDLGIFLIANSVNTFEREGVRQMLCPAYYGTNDIGDGNAWLGVWHLGLTPNTGDLAIWGGQVWQNVNGNLGSGLTSVYMSNLGTGYLVGDILTVDGGDGNATVQVDNIGGGGEIFSVIVLTEGNGYTLEETYNLLGGTGSGAAVGTITLSIDDYSLDAEWTLIPKTSFSNNEYIEMMFSISFDFDNDWIELQWDGKANEFGLNWSQHDSNFNGHPNFVDISDWNFSSKHSSDRFYNNKAAGIYNNTKSGSIIDNQLPGRRRIYNNTGSGDIENNSTEGDIVANANSGDITNNSNIGNIRGNKNTGSIEENSNIGDIGYNTNLSSIEFNTNIGDIYGNSNVGGIYRNNNIGNIGSNSNGSLGDIISVVINNPGTGYAVNDQLQVDGGNSKAFLNVDSVGGGGEITGLSIVVAGTGYSTALGVNLWYQFGGIGVGATVDITANDYVSGVIERNSNNGSINDNSNVGEIQLNSNNGAITNNSISGEITRNSNNGYIAENSNDGNIGGNSNDGDVKFNNIEGSISGNSNNGDIDGNSNTVGLNGGSIYNNSNNGNIKDNSIEGGIFENSNNDNIDGNTGVGDIRKNRCIDEIVSGPVTGDTRVSDVDPLTLIEDGNYIFNGTTATWTLLTVSSANVGWSYKIKNRGSGNLTVDVAGGGSTIYDSAAVASIIIPPGEARELINDGTFWNVL